MIRNKVVKVLHSAGIIIKQSLLASCGLVLGSNSPYLGPFTSGLLACNLLSEMQTAISGDLLESEGEEIPGAGGNLYNTRDDRR